MDYTLTGDVRRPVEPTEQATHSPEHVTARAISRAVGEELRRAREKRGWSRVQLAARMPSGIRERTLMSYEHGTRQPTVVRFMEICRALGASGPVVLNRALQRAHIHLTNLVLRIDVRHVLGSSNEKMRPLRQWARNKLTRYPGGIVELPPSAVVELADFMGCSHQALASYLASFLPEHDGLHQEDAR